MGMGRRKDDDRPAIIASTDDMSFAKRFDPNRAVIMSHSNVESLFRASLYSTIGLQEAAYSVFGGEDPEEVLRGMNEKLQPLKAGAQDYISKSQAKGKTDLLAKVFPEVEEVMKNVVLEAARIGKDPDHSVSCPACGSPLDRHATKCGGCLSGIDINWDKGRNRTIRP